jgi:hypothetical protein
MAKLFWVMAGALVFLVACHKPVRLEQQPSPQSASAIELAREFRAQPRPPLSGSLSISSPAGNFKGELYLAPGGTAPDQKTRGLVYGYMPLGKSLFEFKLSGHDFLYLDLADSTAYSNQSDWLKDHAAEVKLGDQDRIALMLIRGLPALAGDLPEPLVVTASDGKFLEAVSGTGADQELKYYFSRQPLRLSKMELKQRGSVMVMRFEYSGGLWFPELIRLMGEGFSAVVRLEKISCPEQNAPEMNFELPPGFSKILVSGP